MTDKTAPRTFLGENFLLESELARRLYHDYAAKMPIFDYHCHLPPAQIADNASFENLTRIWLAGDHYKWRAMRANGVPERLITGDADDRSKFRAWAETVPQTIGNPLYHWTHLELARPFGITGTLLGPDTADEVYDICNGLLAKQEYRVHGILERMGVAVICTTDDPTDTLEHHQRIARNSRFRVKVLPAFRPDKSYSIQEPSAFGKWVGRLESAAGSSLPDYDAFLSALKSRHDYFHAHGCRLSDHGIEFPAYEQATNEELASIYHKVRDGRAPLAEETLKFRSAVMHELGVMDAESGWTMQLHMGAVRNVNTRMFRVLGPDTGYDSIGDFPIAVGLVRMLDALASRDRLPKTILYNLNPTDNDVIASIVGSFQDGSIPGKVQFGSGWWFNDQKDGMIKQMTTLANHGLLSRFVGMLTDSRSFLSYPRHEYFRRILCNIIGSWVANGEAPNDVKLLGNMVENICYRNAEQYFGLGS